MTPDSHADPAVVPPPVADDAPAMPHVARKVALFVLVLALLNGWIFLHFGFELGSLFVIEVAMAIAAAVTKILTPKDKEAVHAALQRSLYQLLGWQSLRIGFAVLALLTLFSTTVIVTGKDADKVTVDAKTPSFGSDERSIFYFTMWPWGRDVQPALADATHVAVGLRPVLPRVLKTSEFTFAPALLIRVPHNAHANLEGGSIEVLNAETGAPVATALTSSTSASLLLGRRTDVPNTTAAWDTELNGKSPASAQATRTRWRTFAAAQDAKPIPPKIRAVYRTQRQRELNDPNDVTAEAVVAVAGGQALQDVVLLKRERRP
ncbi:MAG TPA: hypothetical protein VF698_03530 [Thermoanaerobaculia bacterium]